MPDGRYCSHQDTATNRAASVHRSEGLATRLDRTVCRSETSFGANCFGTRLPTADRYLTESNWGVVERLEGFAIERGRTLLELAVSWLVRRPQVASVIAGATSPEQVEANVRAAGWALTDEEMQAIDRMTA